MKLKRASGILLHPTSLPGGVLDEHAFRFVLGPAAFGYLRSFRIRAANKSDGAHFEHYVEYLK